MIVTWNHITASLVLLALLANGWAPYLVDAQHPRLRHGAWALNVVVLVVAIVVMLRGFGRG